MPQAPAPCAFTLKPMGINIMIQAWLIGQLKRILLDKETKANIFKALDKAVKDTSSPIDDKAAEVFKSAYEVIIGVL